VRGGARARAGGTGLTTSAASSSRRSPRRRSISISRRVAFSDARRSDVTLSHDGQLVAWIETNDGTRAIMVAEAARMASARPVVRAPAREILPVLIWAPSAEHVVVFRDDDGDENYRAAAIDLASGMLRALTPAGGVRALFHRSSPAHPADLLFSVNARDPRLFDLVRISMETGEATTVFVNPGFSRVHAGADLQPRLAERVADDGAIEVLALGVDGRWAPFAAIPPEDALTTRIERISADGRAVFLIDSRGGDRAALVQVDVATATETTLAADDEADIDAVVFDPGTDRPLVAAATAERRRWHVVDPAIVDLLDHLLRNAGGADLAIDGAACGGARVLARMERSDAADEYQIVGRTDGPVGLFRNREDLEHATLHPMRPVRIPAGDGLRLPGYLTLPAGRERPGPLVLVVHGGPYDRDRWGFSPVHQWLAGRGYAVLAVNFRGSTGFGKAFVAAADHEWGGRMQDDLVDGVQWAVDRGIADPARVGIYGASYGGYAALMAAARDADRFACAVGLGGPSDLLEFMASVPEYWTSWFAMIRRRVADPATAEGREWLAERSPITHVARMTRPVLIAHGLQDVRVRPEQSRALAAELGCRGVSVTLATLPDEGHFLERRENRIALAALVEMFLACYLGGGVEPLGDDLAGTGLQIERGGEFLLPQAREAVTASQARQAGTPRMQA
jgi:dipeptidyl aminopeptidase/acylaminoacyl peptidase